MEEKLLTNHTKRQCKVKILKLLVIYSVINIVVFITAYIVVLSGGADAFYKTFREKWNKQIPSSVKSLELSIDSCLTFFQFPEEEWTSLRTSNIVERLNKEFKRRTKSMEIVAGESACYRLLAFISLKMELGWRANAVGKVRPNLPLYQIYTT